jgi:hypothetical protein
MQAMDLVPLNDIDVSAHRSFFSPLNYSFYIL